MSSTRWPGTEIGKFTLGDFSLYIWHLFNIYTYEVQYKILFLSHKISRLLDRCYKFGRWVPTPLRKKGITNAQYIPLHLSHQRIPSFILNHLLGREKKAGVDAAGGGGDAAGGGATASRMLAELLQAGLSTSHLLIGKKTFLKCHLFCEPKFLTHPAPVENKKMKANI